MIFNHYLIYIKKVDFYNNHFEIDLLNYLKSLDLPSCMTIKFYHNPFGKTFHVGKSALIKLLFSFKS